MNPNSPQASSTKLNTSSSHGTQHRTGVIKDVHSAGNSAALREYPITNEKEAVATFEQLLKFQRVTDARLLIHYYSATTNIKSLQDEIRYAWANWMAGQFTPHKALAEFEQLCAHPKAPAMAWHFLAYFQWENGQQQDALAASSKARQLAGFFNHHTYTQELSWAVQSKSALNNQFAWCLTRFVLAQMLKPLAFVLHLDGFGTPKGLRIMPNHNPLRANVVALKQVDLPSFIQQKELLKPEDVATSLAIHQAQPLLKVKMDIEQVDALIDAGETQTAAQLIEAHIETHPGDAAAHFKLALLLKDEGLYIKALYYGRKGLNLAPHSAQGYHMMGQTLEAMEDAEGAIEAYKTAITFGVEPSWVAQVSRHLAKLYDTHHGDSQNALACMQLARELEPDNLSDLFSLAEAYCASREYQKAAETYRRVLRYQPDNSEIHGFLGYLYWQAGQYEEAESAYLTCLRLTPHNPIALNNLGVLYLDVLNQVDDAIHYFLQSCEQDSAYAMARFNLGRSYLKQGANSKASVFFKEALRINQDSNELAKDEIMTLMEGMID
jgi:tetratricopeptide (TPR) repeat protein